MICLNSYGQDFPKLDSLLRNNFPEDSQTDGRWVYYTEIGNVQKIIKLEVSKVIPNHTFYKVTLVNFLGHHINESDCLVLYESTTDKLLLVKPLWYTDKRKEFFQLFIGSKFLNNESLLSFILELQDLMLIGSQGEFKATEINENKITFDYYIGVNLWRNYEVSLSDYNILSFKSTNPMLNKSIIVK